MSQPGSPFSIHRSLLLALLAGSLLVMGACSETSLNRLQAEFTIVWPGEFGYVDGDVDASRFAFGAVSTGTFRDIEVQIANPGNASLDICSIYLANANFDENGDLSSETVIEIDPEIALLSAQDGPAPGPGSLAGGSAMQFLLHFSPLYGDPIADGLYLVVKHSLNWNCEAENPSGEPLFIPIVGAGEGDPVPDIYANPKIIDFGELDVGRESDPYEVMVGNAGPGLLNVAEVQLLGSNPEHFSLVPGSVASSDFATGEAGFFEVKFTPQHQGTWGAEIHVQSNDPDEQPKIIPMIGVGNAGELGKGPQAICAADKVTTTLVTENFDGSGSFDTDGLALTFSWVLTPPAGSGASFDNPSSPTPSIYLDLGGTYRGDLTVTNSAGQTDSCTQNIEAIPNENFRIEMFWANSGDDMDLHLLNTSATTADAHNAPNDCYYGNTNPDWGVPGYSNDNPALDLDDIPGVGPENINIVEPAVSPYDGWYLVFVHDYPGSVFQGANAVTVNIYLNGALTNTYNFSMSGEDSDYYVAKIHWPTGQIVDCSGGNPC